MKKPRKVINREKQDELPQISSNTEKVYKNILKIMTWFIGISFLLIIIFHLFNNELLDSFSKILYYIVLLILILFSVIEFNADKIKLKIQNFKETTP